MSSGDSFRFYTRYTLLLCPDKKNFENRLRFDEVTVTSLILMVSLLQHTAMAASG